MTTITMDFSDKPKRGRKTERREHDAYMTPTSLVEAIVKRVKVYAPNARNILEPSCGYGEFVAALRKEYPESTIVAVDIRGALAKPEGASHFVAIDFLTIPPADLAEIDLFATNPPFTLYGEFVEHMLNGAKDGATIALLSRFGHLVGSLDAQTWWMTPLANGMTPNRQIVDTLPIHPRPSFTGGGTDSQEYAIIIFRKGFDNGGRFEPIKWDKPETRGRPRKSKTENGKPGGDLFGGTP